MGRVGADREMISEIDRGGGARTRQADDILDSRAAQKLQVGRGTMPPEHGHAARPADRARE